MADLESLSPHSPLAALLARQVRDQGTREAVRSEDSRRSVSFRETGERVVAWTAALRRAGVEPGSFAALSVGNTFAFTELFFALRAAGAAVLSLDSGLKAEGATSVVRTLGARFLLHRDPALGGSSLEGTPDPDVRLLDLGAGTPAPAGTALVKMTSGSTLDPRGACFTEEALVEGIAHIRDGMGLRPDDRVLISIPLSHSYGFDNGVLSLAAIGTPLILQSDVLPAALLRTIREQTVTFFPTVPTIVRALAQAGWRRDTSLRQVICASAPLTAELAEQFLQASGLRVSQFYGASECGGITFERRPEDAAAAGTVGSPLPGVRLELGPEGDVRVHSKANRFALLPRSGPVPDYVETGDRAEWTPEGRLRLLGRVRPLANVGGFKIDLGTIDAFFRGLPGVDDALVLAVDDAVRGQRIVAWVESGRRNPPDLLDQCRQRLSVREVPSEIRVLVRLPRTPRGKVDRDALARFLREAP